MLCTDYYVFILVLYSKHLCMKYVCNTILFSMIMNNEFDLLLILTINKLQLTFNIWKKISHIFILFWNVIPQVKQILQDLQE